MMRWAGLAVGMRVSDCPQNLDTLGIEPRAFRMQSGCDTTTPCAQLPCMLARHLSGACPLLALAAAALGLQLSQRGKQGDARNSSCGLMDKAPPS